MIDRLRTAANTLPIAREFSDVDLDVRQVLFKTKHGRLYRGIFHVDGTEV